MDRRLLQPRWLVAHSVVLAIAVLFVFLGFWQLSRHDDRVSLNELGERRLSAPAEDFEPLLASSDPEAMEYRRVTVSGVFNSELQVLTRSQVYRGTAGFHVLTPLVLEDGRAVLVNRGWVPLEVEQLPEGEISPPEGVTFVEGWVQLSEERPPLGPEDPPEGILTTLNRVDLDRIALQLPMPLAPVYIVQTGGQIGDLPIRVAPPAFDDQGPHLAYAIQWFGFAIVGLVGYFFLARRRLGLSTGGSPRASSRGPAR